MATGQTVRKISRSFPWRRLNDAGFPNLALVNNVAGAGILVGDTDVSVVVFHDNAVGTRVNSIYI